MAAKKTHIVNRDQWDWSLSNCELGRRYGLSPTSVCRTRHKLGLPRYVAPKTRPGPSGKDRTNLRTEARFIPLESLDMATVERFWKCVDVAGPDECWNWRGTSSHGYGKFTLRTPNGSQQHMAHRVAYLLHYRALPTNLVVMHSCDNPRCVNFAHLSLGTDLLNTIDASAKGRMHPGAKTFGAVLTDDIARHIRTCSDLGEGINSIARRIGHHRRTVADVVNRKTWRHVQ